MSSTKRLSFDIDSSQIDIKPILKKEFLELRMRVISTANPNRNNSWFTRESLERSIDTFRNKPILGCFENGDFVSHGGEWDVDEETQLSYWDTWGKGGERILGLIRSDDDLYIKDEENGLSWICLSCALWIQYNFKQVKRLLKDAKKASKNDGTVKNVSVEVDITDFEELPNGVMKINAFNLVGITILGSRYGMKVEPGIEGAELSVVDIMDRNLYEEQKAALRLAYEKLDNSQDAKEDPDMNLNENTVLEQFDDHSENETIIETADCVEEDQPVENKESILEEQASEIQNQQFDCGDSEEEVEESEVDSEAELQMEKPVCEEKEQCEEEHCEEQCEEEHCENSEEEDEEEKEQCEEEHCEKETECYEEPCEEKEEPIEKEEEHCEEQYEFKPEIWDLTAGISGLEDLQARLTESADFYEDEMIKGAFGRWSEILRDLQLEMSIVLTYILQNAITDENKELIEKYNHLGSYSSVCKLFEETCAHIRAEEEERQYQSFLAEAENLITSCSFAISEEDKNQLLTACNTKTITNMSQLKNSIGQILVQNTLLKNTKVEKNETPKSDIVDFSYNISQPQTKIITDTKVATKTSSWDKLAEYLGK